MKKFLKNKGFQMALSFIVGGFVATLLFQEEIIIKKEKEIVEVEKIVEKEVIKYVDKIVEVDKIVHERVKVVKRKEIFPDGRILEEEIYESESEQIDRIREAEKRKYEEAVVMKEAELKEKYSSLKIHKNPKRFTLFAGTGSKLGDLFKESFYLGGFSTMLWGPFTIGAHVATNKTAAIMFGFRF